MPGCARKPQGRQAASEVDRIGSRPQIIVHISPTKPVVLVEDNGPIHVSNLLLAVLAARAHWLIVEWLPKYALELNDIEVGWHDLEAHHLAHQTFTDTHAQSANSRISA